MAAGAGFGLAAPEAELIASEGRNPPVPDPRPAAPAQDAAAPAQDAPRQSAGEDPGGDRPATSPLS